MFDFAHSLSVFLLAQADIERDMFQWGRIHQNTDWILPLLVVGVMFLYIYRIYKKDAVETARPLRWLLRTLRCVAVLALLVMYLQPQWRHEKESTIPSRAVIFVDSSLSMAIADQPAEKSGTEKIRRWDAVKSVLTDEPFIDALREKRDVQILTFDSGVKELAFLTKKSDKPEQDGKADDGQKKDAEKTASSKIVTDLGAVDPRGQQTALSDAVSAWLNTQRNTPLSAVAVLSDGAQNVGATPEADAVSAAERHLMVHTIGVGSAEIPANVRVYNVQAPQRVQPNDPFSVTAFIQNQSYEGKTVVIDLMETPEGKTEETLSSTQSVVLGTDNELQKVAFEVPPQPVGKKKYTVKVRALANESDKTDNSDSVVVESADRKLQVLLFAGGPSREYQFLRTLLARDKSMELDTLLQTAVGNISQEGRKILAAFPATPQELFAYDAIIAIDPNFNDLTAEQVQSLEKWIGDRAGGMIFIAGPVYLGEPIHSWRENDVCKPILKMFPVEFPRQFSTSGATRQTASSPFPLQFTREGTEADFLRLDDDSSESETRWNEFEGFYSFFPVDRAKDSATVYARFSDPSTEVRGELPPLIVEQFYGSGRSIYIGSGELWRLRSVDETLYERLLTQLVRRVAQGSLMRQSDRGTFLPRQDRYYLGDVIEVHAQLTDSSGAPLTVQELIAEMTTADGRKSAVALKPDAAHAGAYIGQALADAEGAVVFTLAVPGSDVLLECRARVELSDLERRNPQRNEVLLKSWASLTGGTYFNQIDEFHSLKLNPDQLDKYFPDNSATVIAVQSIDSKWEELLMKWLIGIAVGALCLEWLIRRLMRLA